MKATKYLIYLALLAITVVAPFVFPDFRTQLATLWLMIIVALTWDMTGGQMGYNSLGNIFFYGTGMYVAALVAIGLVYDIGEYTAAAGTRRGTSFSVNVTDVPDGTVDNEDWFFEPFGVQLPEQVILDVIDCDVVVEAALAVETEVTRFPERP